MHFAGQFERTLDEKGRVVLPSRLRDGLAGGQVLISDFGDRLSIWPADAFEEFVDGLTDDLQSRVEEGGIEDEDINETLDYLWASAQPIKPDAQGRIVVPDELLTDELRGSEVVIAGNREHIDVFPAAEYYAKHEAARPKVADALAKRRRKRSPQ